MVKGLKYIRTALLLFHQVESGHVVLVLHVSKAKYTSVFESTDSNASFQKIGTNLNLKPSFGQRIYAELIKDFPKFSCL